MTSDNPTHTLSDHWDISELQLKRTYELPSFKQAIDFMAACVEGIDTMDHHPVWTNRYRKVTVELQSHDLGKVTARDHALAVHMDAVFERMTR